MPRWMTVATMAVLTVGCVTRCFGGDKVVLVKNGHPMATIVIADEPVRIPLDGTAPVSRQPVPLTVAYAANELQILVEKATGVRLPIVAASKAPTTGALVLVGRSTLSEKAGLTLPSKPEGLRFVAFDRGLAILGEIAPKGTNGIDVEMDRGTLFGVYEFLERGLGYRFYFYNEKDAELGVVTPHLKDVVVPGDFKVELAPDFPFRASALGLDWIRAYRDGSSTGYTGNHTDQTWDALYRKDHPEYFALQKDGTRSDQALCYSEPKVLAQRLANVERFYKTGSGEGWYFTPNEKYVPFVPRDAPQAGCQCPRCLALTRKVEEVGRFGMASDIIFRHGADLAAEVKKRWPDRRVSMLAYEDYTLPPSFDIPDNLDVMVCQMHASTMNKEPYWFQYNLKLLQDWSAKVGHKRERLYVFDYICWPGFWTSAPYIFPHSLQQWLQASYSLSSGELVCPGGDVQREHYMSWLWHRLMWDRNADVDALLHDYAAKFYGPAGKPMEKLYRLLSDRYENVHWSRQLGDSYVPPDLWYLETFTPETITQLKKLSADALAACSANPTDLYHRRVVWMQQSLNAFFSEADLAHKWLNHAPSYTIATLKKAPDDNAWASIPTARLVQGNFGADADLETTVQAVCHGEDIYVRFVAARPTPKPTKDSLTLQLPIPGGLVSWTLNADGTTEGKHPVTLIRRQCADTQWIAVAKLRVLGAAMSMQFLRHLERPDRNKSPIVADYVWSPQMSPPWPYLMRWGTLKLKN